MIKKNRRNLFKFQIRALTLLLLTFCQSLTPGMQFSYSVSFCLSELNILIEAIFIMENILEQRACIKFCVKNEISCAETLRMLTKAFGESCMSKTAAYMWYKRFKDGRTSTEHDEIPGRPTASVTEENIESAKRIVLENRSISVRKLAALLSISYGSAEHILTNVLGMKSHERKFEAF